MKINFKNKIIFPIIFFLGIFISIHQADALTVKSGHPRIWLTPESKLMIERQCQP
jgi:hypothetical protein